MWVESSRKTLGWLSPLEQLAEVLARGPESATLQDLLWWPVLAMGRGFRTISEDINDQKPDRTFESSHPLFAQGHGLARLVGLVTMERHTDVL